MLPRKILVPDNGMWQGAVLLTTRPESAVRPRSAKDSQNRMAGNVDSATGRSTHG